MSKPLSFLRPLALTLAFVTAVSAPVQAQELRFGIDHSLSNLQHLRGSEGSGFGARWLFWDAIGVGVDYDRFTAANTFRGTVCEPPGDLDGACRFDDLAFDSRSDLFTIYGLMDIARSGGWTGRILLGRTAGRARGSGVGEESGWRAAPPPADRGGGAVGLSRGMDGSVLGIELLRAFPAGLPLGLQAGIRYHRLDGDGCVQGEISSFCGDISMTQFQLGLVIDLGWRPGGDG